MYETSTNMYTFGRGKIYVSELLNANADMAVVNNKFRYLGNTPGFTISIETENLDHYSSDSGFREKDASVQLQINRTGSLICDNINIDNLCLFHFATREPIVQAASDSTETFANIIKGMTYVLGVTEQNRVGTRVIDDTPEKAVVVKSGDKTLIEEADYQVNYASGSITFLSNGKTLKDGDTVTVAYSVPAMTYDRVVSGDTPSVVEVRYEAVNAAGQNQVYWFPYVKLQPNGEFGFKSDTWQQMQFKVEILKRGALRPIYIDNQPHPMP